MIPFSKIDHYRYKFGIYRSINSEHGGKSQYGSEDYMKLADLRAYKC